MVGCLFAYKSFCLLSLGSRKGNLFFARKVRRLALYTLPELVETQYGRRMALAASVLIVVAGMEGALPSVVAGMVSRPVIAVPTSVGYGVSLGGLTALFAMLNSCSSNVAVVNIDNGFGAGYMASIINRK